MRWERTTGGGWKPKYLLVLAGSPFGDVIYRLLTSRAYGRPKDPPCFPSGGQTGADRAALDFAITRGYPHGGR